MTRAMYAGEVLEFFGISSTTLTRYIRSGKVKAVKFGKRYLIPWQQFVDAGMVEETDIRTYIDGRSGRENLEDGR